MQPTGDAWPGKKFLSHNGTVSRETLSPKLAFGQFGTSLAQQGGGVTYDHSAVRDLRPCCVWRFLRGAAARGYDQTGIQCLVEG